MPYPQLIKDQHLAPVPSKQKKKVTHTKAKAEADGICHLWGGAGFFTREEIKIKIKDINEKREKNIQVSCSYCM